LGGVLSQKPLLSGGRKVRDVPDAKTAKRERNFASIVEAKGERKSEGGIKNDEGRRILWRSDIKWRDGG